MRFQARGAFPPILRQHGYAARPLQDGLLEWRRAGLPVTTRAA
jgi:hypothetical protein